MAIIAYKISELYCVYCIKADDCKIKKKNDEQTISYLLMRTRFYFRYYAHSILFRNRYRKEHDFKDINDTVFCMYGNWKYGIILRIPKVYGKSK